VPTCVLIFLMGRILKKKPKRTDFMNCGKILEFIWVLKGWKRLKSILEIGNEFQNKIHVWAKS
jgi:hypothetical protein